MSALADTPGYAPAGARTPVHARAGEKAAARLRIGVVDFVQLHLPFAPRVAQALADRAEFFYFQPQTDVAALQGRESNLWVLERTPPTALDLSDGELLRLCGRHQWMKADSLPQMLAQARDAIERLETFLEQTRVECLLLWNGASLFSRLARELARRRRIGVLYFENGYLPGTMQIATEGVNAFNEHTRHIASGLFHEFEYDGAALDDALERLRSGRAAPGAEPPPKPGPTPLRRLRRELLRFAGPSAWRWTRTLGRGRFLKRLPPDFPESFALLPMQVTKDSQLNLHSPLVANDMPRLILETYVALRQALPRHRLVVKLHPKESAYRRRVYLDVMRKLPDVVFVDGSSMRELLPRCDLLVTVNSTAGVEALAFGKPVVALGRNFYVTPELVEVVEHWESLPAALRRAVAEPKSPQTRRQFLGYLHQRMLVPGSHLDLSARSIDALAQRIWTLVQAVCR